MSDSIIAQVRALANCNAYDYQGGHYDADGRRIPIPNWSALLAHLERTQAVVDAAREVMERQKADWIDAVTKEYDKEYAEKMWPRHARLDGRFGDLNAALENLENRDGK